jgi:hypothetical protein
MTKDNLKLFFDMLKILENSKEEGSEFHRGLLLKFRNLHFGLGLSWMTFAIVKLSQPGNISLGLAGKKSRQLQQPLIK